jgi:hypothetical protein
MTVTGATEKADIEPIVSFIDCMRINLVLLLSDGLSQPISRGASKEISGHF